jgi:hypothetical protein
LNFLTYIVLILCLLIAAIPSNAQLVIELSQEVHLSVNDMDIDFSDLWLDSLIHDAQSGKIVYKIVYANCSNSKIITKIQLPQTLPLDKVYRQIVLYYSLLRNEEDRESQI